MTQSVLLIGAYGQNNIGDDALLEVFLDCLKDDYIVVNSAQPEITEAMYGVKTMPTYFKIPGLSLVRAILDADLIVFGGGSLLKEIEGPAFGRVNYLLRILGLVSLARLTGGKTAMVSVGMGPLHGKTYRVLSRLCANLTDFITVRDEESKALLQEVGTSTKVVATADAVFTVPAVDSPPRADEHRATVAVIPRYSLNQNERTALARSCDALIENQNARIVFVPFQTGFRAEFDDEACARDIRSMMKRPETASVITPSRVDETMALLSSSDLIVSARLHGLILGAIQGVPSIALGYDMKVQSFMAKLDRSNACLSLRELADGKLNNVIEREWPNRFEAREEITARVTDLRKDAARSFTMLAEQRTTWASRPSRSGVPATLRWTALLSVAAALVFRLRHRS